ncbi:MAG: putative heme d1 biosynthesis radical SAM protein NirJ1 [Bacillota bacterium]|nr:putative heme d1 biosynthesis radical SAM protein NirJ1 [Bacillota bacterium]
MLSITKLLCDSENYGDSIRYIKGAAQQRHGVSEGRGPVVVWNCTKTCNLKCRHCYADADNKSHEGELNLAEAKEMLKDLREFNVPVVLFSGGEPLVRKDFFDLLTYASDIGLRSTISTNGTLLTKDVCKRIKEIGVGYVGISLDGVGTRHDEFRGTKGCFDSALRGIRNCIELNQRVGLRFTINKYNYDQLEDIFYLIKKEGIPRVCFYHLVYSGRGNEMVKEDISKEETRAAMDLIISKAAEFGPKVEILTVDNHADGAYVYLKSREIYKHRTDRILELLSMSGGNRSGSAFANVDFYGNIHSDQFSWQYNLGNVRTEKFSKLWSEGKHPILQSLRNRKELLKGRCSRCKWINQCNGNFRTRAEAVTGDFWQEDPACYLYDNEI